MTEEEKVVKISPASLVVILIFCMFFITGCIDGGSEMSSYEEDGSLDLNNTTTEPTMSGSIEIEDVGEFSFDPEKIGTVRSDIFRKGYFSIFDILVYLNSTEVIQMKYHFDESMNTHVIDSIDGEKGWWYMAYYDGGWPEENTFRMDHYPYKDKMYIRVFEEDEIVIEEIYEVFRGETSRREDEGGDLIIPEVLIRSPSNDLRFEDVKVTSHNLRSDIFQPGVITAIDVIMSLEEQGKITYAIKWYESIGTAEIVKNYYVEAINDDVAYGRCGFVYEDGATKYRGVKGNHIHVQSDIRVLNSPEYQEWFWICL